MGAVALPDLVLDRTGLRHVTHPTAVNVVQEACSLPVLLSSWSHHRAFLDFGVRTLGRYAPSTFERVNGLRGLARRVGMYELARRRAPNRVVLSDEGTVLAAYHFALSDVELDPRDLARFASLVPRPDWIVHVKAPVPVLVRRAVSRPDRRRQHLGRSRERIERTIRRTVDVFDLVAAAPAATRPGDRRRERRRGPRSSPGARRRALGLLTRSATPWGASPVLTTVSRALRAARSARRSGTATGKATGPSRPR